MENIKFCSCGRALDVKFNFAFDGLFPGHCNKRCFDVFTRPKKKRQQKKYGVAGRIYNQKRMVSLK